MSSHHILARADALMHRRRQPSEAEDVPILTDVVEAETSAQNDIPATQPASMDDPLASLAALPTVEVAEPLAAAASGTPPSPAAAVVSAFRDKLRQQLIDHLQAHLQLMLPAIVDAALQELLPNPDEQPPS